MTDWIKRHTFIVDWIQHRLSEKQFFILASILIGLSAGLAAVLLKSLVHFVYHAVTQDFSLPFQFSIYIFLPFIGLLLTVIYIQRLHKDTFEKADGKVFIHCNKLTD